MGKTQPKVKQAIVIDEAKNLVFSNEEELFGFFESDVLHLEKEFFNLRINDDIPETDFFLFEKNLDSLLERPDEIWCDEESLEEKKIYIYLKEFSEADNSFSEQVLFHVALTYTTNGIPSFVYLHFPTNDVSLLEKYQRGEIIYDRVYNEAPAGSLDGDALLEGDEFAVGLYNAMLTLRSETDIPEVEFRDYAHARERAIEEADEIWRSNDTMGNILVSFIKEFEEENDRFYYIVVTIEDSPSNTHALLFSFPTKDKNLLLRYRQGENLQADEVTQESSH